MSKLLGLTIGGVLLLVLSSCGAIQPPVIDSVSPQISVMVSDSRYNANDVYSYMLYQSSGPRTETGFVTTDGSANIRAHASDLGGVKTIVFRAENGTLTPAPYIGDRTIETSVDGNASIVTIYGDQNYAMTPLEHLVTLTPNDSNEVIVSVSTQDLGGLEGHSNTTTTPDIKIVFSSQ